MTLMVFSREPRIEPIPSLSKFGWNVNLDIYYMKKM